MPSTAQYFALPRAPGRHEQQPGEEQDAGEARARSSSSTPSSQPSRKPRGSPARPGRHDRADGHRPRPLAGRQRLQRRRAASFFARCARRGAPRRRPRALVARVSACRGSCASSPCAPHVNGASIPTMPGSYEPDERLIALAAVAATLLAAASAAEAVTPRAPRASSARCGPRGDGRPARSTTRSGRSCAGPA